VLSSSLHGIVLAEAFRIPARMLRLTENEPLYKYQDYYEGRSPGPLSSALHNKPYPKP
jgi:pyruvyltransferase